MMVSRLDHFVIVAFGTFIFLFQNAAAADTDIRESDSFHPTVRDTYDAHLFEPSDTIRIASPSHFPKPTRKIDAHAVPIVEPTYGRHRPSRDAVLAYAEGYKLSYYIMFVETLKATNFTGDVVLAIAEERIIKPDVVDYLRSYALSGDANSNGDDDDDGDDDDQLHVVVYQTILDCDPRDGKTGRHQMPTGDTDVFQMCQLSHVYGWKDDHDGHVTGTAQDPRDGRVVATLRYEWYWIWSLRYRPTSWLMLLDARDSFFQSNPFADVPRQVETSTMDIVDGLLYLFGENAEATRLGKSRKNLKWLSNGYGEATLKALEDKPTICSGSSMGEQVAVETYLRAMVNEHDECHIKMTGSDQGFHNYLYYSSKLRHADTIRRIVVWEQGWGAINNLGAMRTKELSEWGIYDEAEHVVYQWDGVTKSPVVHQWDRDNKLHKYMHGERHKDWEAWWQKEKVARNAKR